MYAGVAEVHATNDYKLVLTFDNKERRMFDMTPYLDVGRFAELKNIEAFKQVSVSFDTIEWENDLDLDPEFLYEHSTILAEPTPIVQRNGQDTDDASGVQEKIMAGFDG